MLHFGIKKPEGTLFLFLTLVFFGFMAYKVLPRERYPRLEYPVITVVTFMENFSPSEIKNLITVPMEEVLASIPELKDMESSSFEGVSVIRLFFEWGSSLDERYFDVREKLDYCKSILPQYASRPLALKMDINSEPILLIRVDFRDEAVKGNERNYLKKVVIPFLEMVEGVARVEILGGEEKEIQVEVDLDKLYANQLDLEEISKIVSENQGEYPVGVFRHQNKEYQVRIESLFRDYTRFGSLMVGKNYKGEPLFLSQVATIQYGSKKPLVLYHHQGEPAVALLIYKEGNANIVSTAHGVIKALKVLENQNPMNFTVIRNEAKIIEEALHNILMTVIVSLVVVVGVVYWFLRNGEMAIVVSVAIPVSLSLTFLLMYLSGISLNFISILGVSLSLGTMVDSNIVFVETYLREGKERLYQVLKRLAGPLMVSQLTNVAIFLPVLSIRGIGKALFGELAEVMFFVTLCVIAEVFFLTPALLSLFTSHSGKRKLQLPSHWQIFKEKYATSFLWFFERREWFSVVLSVMLGFSIIGLFFLKKTFIPFLGETEIVLDIVYPPNTSLKKSEEYISPIEKLLLGQKGIENVSSTIGRYAYLMLFRKQTEPNYVEMRIFCKNLGVKRRIRRWLEKRKEELFPGASVIIKEPENFFSKIWNERKEVTFLGTSSVLDSFSKVVIDGLTKFEAKGVRVFPDSFSVLQMKMDRVLLNHHGLSAKKVGDIARIAFEGTVATTIETQEEMEMDVRIRLNTNTLLDLSMMKKLLVKKPDGAFVHIGDFVEASYEDQPKEILRKSQKDCLKIYFDMKESDLRRFQKWISGKRFPETSIEFSWESKDMRRALAQLGWCFGVSIILIFCLVMLQFNDLWLTIITLCSIPFIFVGITPLLFITGNSLNVVSMLGMIMLVGLVINGTIFLLEEIKEVSSGRYVFDVFIYKIIEASSRRVVPVLLTTITTIFALLPMIFFPGTGMEYQRLLSLCLFGGLGASTLFSLYVVPMLYVRIVRKRSI